MACPCPQDTDGPWGCSGPAQRSQDSGVDRRPHHLGPLHVLLLFFVVLLLVLQVLF